MITAEVGRPGEIGIERHREAVIGAKRHSRADLAGQCQAGARAGRVELRLEQVAHREPQLDRAQVDHDARVHVEPAAAARVQLLRGLERVSRSGREDGQSPALPYTYLSAAPTCRPETIVWSTLTPTWVVVSRSSCEAGTADVDVSAA